MCEQQKLGKRKLFKLARSTFNFINFPHISFCQYYLVFDDEVLLFNEEYIGGCYRRVSLIRGIDTGRWQVDVF